MAASDTVLGSGHLGGGPAVGQLADRPGPREQCETGGAATWSLQLVGICQSVTEQAEIPVIPQGDLGQIRLRRGRSRPAVTSSLWGPSRLKGPEQRGDMFCSDAVKESPFLH